MEKDYFKDRHPIINEHDAVLPGDEVFICLKNMQPYAKELQDLTKIKVTNYLTSQPYHPRGQKVKGLELIWDDKNKTFIEEERVGRITYKIVDKYLVPTTEGTKYIVKNENKLKLSLYEEIKNKIIIFLVLTYDEFKFKINIDPWRYFNSIEEIQSFIVAQKISDAKLRTDRITLTINNIPYEFFDFEIECRDVLLNLQNKELFEFFISKYPASNNSQYDFNKFFDLKVDSIELRNPVKIDLNF